MKSTLRSKLAAAVMLLLPVGAMLAASPASAQHRDDPRDRGQGSSHDRDFYRGDHRAPRIFDLTPEQGDRVSERGLTRISARFGDRGAGVAAVTLRVDGRDVTRRAQVDGNDIRYADNLAPGRHWAELVVSDRAGNTARRSWAFDVVGRGHGQYGAYGQQPQRW
jgi:hypothetical protein